MADPFRIFAQTLGTYPPGQALDELSRIHRENGIELIVIGWPLTLEGQEGEVTGSSTSFGLGYRFRLSRLVGLGAGLHYHSFSMKEETIDNTKEDVSDKVTNFMPVLELTIITR